MKKKRILGFGMMFLLFISGCGKSKIEDFKLTLNNQLPVQIRNIYIENDKDNNVITAQDILMGSNAEFNIDGSLNKVNVVVTPKNMFAYSISLNLSNSKEHSGKYDIILDKNELTLKKAKK